MHISSIPLVLCKPVVGQVVALGSRVCHVCGKLTKNTIHTIVICKNLVTCNNDYYQFQDGWNTAASLKYVSNIFSLWGWCNGVVFETICKQTKNARHFIFGVNHAMVNINMIY